MVTRSASSSGTCPGTRRRATCLHLRTPRPSSTHRSTTSSSASATTSRAADLVLLGSYVPDGAEIASFVLQRASGVVAFYDIDTPVTLAALDAGTCDYLSDDCIPEFDAYLSFTGGAALEALTHRFGARRARAFYCLVDPALYVPLPAPPARARAGVPRHVRRGSPARARRAAPGTRQAAAGAGVRRGGPAVSGRRRVAAPTCGASSTCPRASIAAFYASQRLTLNLTRRDMIDWGWSPSVRLFEAAACGVPIISDWWSGLDSFFEPGKEILIARVRERRRRDHHDDRR